MPPCRARQSSQALFRAWRSANQRDQPPSAYRSIPSGHLSGSGELDKRGYRNVTDHFAVSMISLDLFRIILDRD
jgi:hypothetical protein